MKSTSLIALAFGLLLFAACKQRFFRASSSSMEKTLKTGDQFMVTPKSSFNHNDIVVFDVYSNDYLSGPDEETGQLKKRWQKRVHRLIAMSGDTLLIRNGIVYLNQKLVPLPSTAMMDYEIISDSVIPEFAERDELQVRIENLGSKIKYTLPLTNNEALAYKNRSGVNSVEIALLKENLSIVSLAAPVRDLHWSIDNYGPIRIPIPGETISVDSSNYLLFQNIPGIHTGDFKIQEKLYFLMGDNRHFAEDSRYTGFISQSKMYGVVK